ncbi:hypothetical protein BGZ95_000705 [Linnemannia exigua]|uniref:Uncharacterized protein n=1 Tax=Linnemannia exigua TaxID=604196 RepID=A0AAD4D8B0_9FUNG|nr:hypothetical protein BGZ95_000705 [Linnemannia exigua]
MTQHYQRTAMPPMSSGMPIIPPRLQQQQQHEMLMNNRRQQHFQQQQQQQQYYPQQQQQQQHQQQQQYPFRPTHNQNPGPLPFTGHTRSVSSGSNNSAHHNSSGSRGLRPLNGPLSPTGGNYPIHPNNNGYNHQLQQQHQQGPGGRLRSESNPSYSSTGRNHHPGSSSTFHASGSNGGGLPTRANSSGTAGSTFQERLKERDRERQGRERDERDAAARAIREDPKLSATLINSTAAAKEAAAAAAATAQSTGTALWNRLRAAKDVINVAITGEERWPDSDDSDHEGESHVSRVLREYAEIKEVKEITARIDQLDRMPSSSSLSANSSTGSSYSGSRNRTLRDAVRQEHSTVAAAPTSLASSASSSDYLGRSRSRTNGETGHQTSRSEDSSTSFRPPIRTKEIGQGSRPAVAGPSSLSPPASPATPTETPSPTSASLETPRIGNRFRTSSDASLSAALGRLEGKRNQDALVAQVSHLGSTRARSPHRGNRAYREHIDVAPPPPLPTPKSDYRQQRQPLTPSFSSPSLISSSLSPSTASSPSLRRNGTLPQGDQGVKPNLGAYGQRQQQQQQQQPQQQQQARYF